MPIPARTTGCPRATSLQSHDGEVMSTLTVELPESLMNTVEALAAREGYSPSQFLANAAGAKVAAVLTTECLRREAAAGRPEDSERYLAAVPDLPPLPGDEL